MTLRVSLDGRFDPAISSDLRELADKLAENGIATKTNTIVIPGVKADLVIGLAIASLTVSSVSTLIAVINFWRGQKASYRLTFDTGDGAAPLDQAGNAALTAAIEAGSPVSVVIERCN